MMVAIDGKIEREWLNISARLSSFGILDTYSLIFRERGKNSPISLSLGMDVNVK